MVSKNVIVNLTKRNNEMELAMTWRKNTSGVVEFSYITLMLITLAFLDFKVLNGCKDNIF